MNGGWWHGSEVWFAVGFAGQALFGSRFVVQWLASERQGRVVIPVQFWVLSLLGGIALLGYALHRRDPVFATSQGFGLLVYSRNLWLLSRGRLTT